MTDNEGKYMTYSPENRNRKPLLITVLITALSVFCFIYAGRFPNYTWLMQLGFIIFATTAIQIFLRYVMTSFEYCCDGESIIIYKSVGSKKQMIGKLELLNSASYMMSEKKYRECGENYNVKSKYTYTRNYKTLNNYIYITTLGETNYMITLEANENFAEYVNKKIDEIMKGQQCNDKI